MDRVYKLTFDRVINGTRYTKTTLCSVICHNKVYYALKGGEATLSDFAIKEGNKLVSVDFTKLLGSSLNERSLVNSISSQFDEACTKKVLKSLSSTNKIRRIRDIRDCICYHITESSKRESIDIKGFRPGEYVSDLRMAIDRVVDDCRPAVDEFNDFISREKSVFLYPTLNEALLKGTTQFKHFDVYAVLVDTDRIWLAPSKINEVFIHDIRQTEEDLTDYFEDLKVFAAEYWKNSVGFNECSESKYSNYEVLAYDDDSILNFKRVGMFNNEGILFPLDNYNFWAD